MNYTLAVTSCNRFDLLKQTLESFAFHADIPPAEVIILDDSAEAKPGFPQSIFQGIPVRWISNGRHRGQMFSIDKLYDQIKTELVFHCEDDWLFERGPFIGPSSGILELYPHVWTVSLRGNQCNGHPLAKDLRSPLMLNEPGWRAGWGGCHFNPGLRRMSDFRRIGGGYGRYTGYGTHGCETELSLSKMHLDMGYRIAVLPHITKQPFIRHLGHAVSRASAPIPPQPKVLIAVPAAQKYEYQRHNLSVPRVIDGRVSAVRETWMDDVRKFPYVDAKFFYGQPVRDAVGDEVFVNAPDDYEGLSVKVKEICRYALAMGYSHLVKADDDTVIYLDRLLRSGFDAVDQMGYFGCTHAPGRCSCYATGMCYTLNRRCMELVVKAPITHWAEDLWVGSVLRAAGIRPTGHPGFLPGFGAHYVKFPLPPGTVAAHSVKPNDMRAWYAELTNPSSEGILAQPKGTPKGNGIAAPGKEESCDICQEDPLPWL